MRKIFKIIEENTQNIWEKYCKSLRKILEIIEQNTQNIWEKYCKTLKKYWKLLKELLKTFERNTAKQHELAKGQNLLARQSEPIYSAALRVVQTRMIFFIITIICSWIMICLFRLAKKYLQNDKFVSNRSCAMPTKCLTFNNICGGRVFVIFRWETICYIFLLPQRVKQQMVRKSESNKMNKVWETTQRRKQGNLYRFFNHKSQSNFSRIFSLWGRLCMRWLHGIE